jgi:hypothetical protein
MGIIYNYEDSFIRSEPIPFANSGKSCAKFYQSSDKLFIIKTLTSEEVEQMHALLKQYHPVSLVIKLNTTI